MLNEAQENKSETNSEIMPENSDAPQAYKSPETNEASSPDKKSGGLKSKWPFLVIAILFVLLVSMGGYIFVGMNKSDSIPTVPTPTPAEQVACTQDAKECPDGSFVSRQGPKCEFAPCPSGTASSSADTSNWKSYSIFEGFSIKYPSDKFVRLICSGEGLILKVRTAEDTTDEQTPVSCGRDGLFPIEVQVSKTQPTISTTSENGYNVTKKTVSVGGVNGTAYIIDPTDKCLGQCHPWTYEVTLSKDGNYYSFYLTKEEYMDIFNDMLSTFSFNGLSESSVGESCGPNAGAAGDVMCESGLTCKNINSSGVGTCAK